MSKHRTRKPKHVSGFISILGRPNTGKSTLLNALVGVKLAIVANKPQTTRTSVQGVWTTPEAQLVFVDTPGIHEGETLFNRRMMKTINEALDGRDLLLFVVDASRAPGAEDAKALELVRASKTPAFAVFNKTDLVEDKRSMLPLMDKYRELHDFAAYHPVSAQTGEGLDELRNAVIAQMPAGPAYFPDDYLTDQPERFLAAEIIREQVLLAARQEVPHATAVLVDEWKKEGRLTRISATIHVERAGQKSILIGAKGQLLKEIGTQARLAMEAQFERKIFLSLFVKVSSKWRENESFLQDLDWRAMAGAAGSGDVHNGDE